MNETEDQITALTGRSHVSHETTTNMSLFHE
jgi:hypothetical protein